MPGAAPETWLIINPLFQDSQRGLFCLLFGAGIVLLTSRLESRHEGLLPADIYFRRNLWLLGFGMLNGYLFMWSGDILVPYALAGLLLFPLRILAPRHLIAICAVILLGVTLAAVSTLATRIDQHGEYLSALAVKESGAELSEEQQGALDSWEKFPPDYQGEDIQKQISEMRGGLGDILFSDNVSPYWEKPPFFLFNKWFWGDICFIVLGMALLKLGILDGSRNRSFYQRLLLVSYGVGLPLSFAEAWWSYSSGFERLAMVSTSISWEVSRALMTLGHMSLVILLCRSGVMRRLINGLKYAGRMALTNYLTQSIVCALIFYGFAGGLYGKIYGYHLCGFVLAIWVLQIAWSKAWLARFRLGPFEWLWRSLTYWRWQPMRRSTSGRDGGPEKEAVV